jgi:hypothetical protein
MRRLIVLTLLAFMGCTNSQNESIELPFALLSSDELQAPTPGTPCTYSPITSSAGFYRTDGFVDLDPNINPSPGYVLALQVENYLDNTTLADSNGNVVSGRSETTSWSRTQSSPTFPSRATWLRTFRREIPTIRPSS